MGSDLEYQWGQVLQNGMAAQMTDDAVLQDLTQAMQAGVPLQGRFF